jgi:MFS family permease
VAWLIDRLGPRLTIAIGGACMGFGLMLMTMGHTLAALIATYGLLCGVGVALSGMPANYVIISGRYPRRVATATAIAGSGMGIGVLLIVPLVQWNADRIGWRISTLWAGVAVVAVVTIASMVLLEGAPTDRDGSDGLLDASEGDRDQALQGGLAAALRKMRSVFLTRQWQGFALANLLMGAAVFAVFAHQVAAFDKIGWNAFIASTSLGALYMLRSATAPVWGAMLDRRDRRRVYAVSVSLAVVGIASLVVVEAASMSSLLMACLFMAAFGIGSAGTMPTDASLGNELFSARERGIAWGMTEAAYAAGAATGALGRGPVVRSDRQLQRRLFGRGARIDRLIFCRACTEPDARKAARFALNVHRRWAVPVAPRRRRGPPSFPLLEERRE